MRDDPQRSKQLDAYIAAQPPEVQRALEELRACIWKAAPGVSELMNYNNPALVDAAFGDREREIQQDRTLAQAFLAFSVFAAQVKCGHPYPNFFDQSEAVSAALFRVPRLPFFFRWLDGRMIVTRSPAGTPAA